MSTGVLNGEPQLRWTTMQRLAGWPMTGTFMAGEKLLAVSSHCCTVPSVAPTRIPRRPQPGTAFSCGMNRSSRYLRITNLRLPEMTLTLGLSKRRRMDENLMDRTELSVDRDTAQRLRSDCQQIVSSDATRGLASHHGASSRKLR
jgi:hypothetical protein